MKKLLLSALALAALFLTACEEDALQNTVIDYTAPELEVSDESVDVGATSGSTGSFTFTTDQTTVVVEADYSCKSWIDISVSGGTVTITAKADNPTINPRNGKVHVLVGEKGITAEAWVNVVQAGNPNFPKLELSPASDINFAGDSSDASENISIDTNQGAASASVNAEAAGWLSAVVNGTTLTISVLSQNTGDSKRDGVVTVTAGTLNATIKVSQGILPPAGATTYTLISKAANLVPGDYIMAAYVPSGDHTGYHAFIGSMSNNNCVTEKITYDSATGTLEFTEAVMVSIVSPSEGQYAIGWADGTKYLKNGSQASYLGTATSLDEAQKWTISDATDGGIFFTSVSEPTSIIKSSVNGTVRFIRSFAATDTKTVGIFFFKKN